MSDDSMPLDALLAQGCCCGSGCENCPYVDDAGTRHMAGTTTLNQKWVDAKTANPSLAYSDWQASVTAAPTPAPQTEPPVVESTINNGTQAPAAPTENPISTPTTTPTP